MVCDVLLHSYVFRGVLKQCFYVKPIHCLERVFHFLISQSVSLSSYSVETLYPDRDFVNKSGHEILLLQLSSFFYIV